MAIEKIKIILNEYEFEYELEVINDLQEALELNIINPPAILINGQKVFEKRWPSQSQLRRVIELMIE
ncbi:MAG: thioredoxin family protein [Halanaerobiales bacterium]